MIRDEKIARNAKYTLRPLPLEQIKPDPAQSIERAPRKLQRPRGNARLAARIGNWVMFGRSKTGGAQDGLSERMRKAVDRKTTTAPAAYPIARQIERAVRQAVFRQGALLLANGEKLPVALKNISATGARVEYFTRRELPEIVTLVEPTLRVKTRARVVWQGEGIAGLAFIAD